MKLKPNRRNRNKYPGLVKELNLKIRQELIDQDYIDKLSETEKEWLNRFNNEYVSASVYPKKTKDKQKLLHNTKKLKKDCTDRNNWRNNDVYGIKKISNMLKEEKEYISLVEDNSNLTADEIENLMVEMIDDKLENT